MPKVKSQKNYDTKDWTQQSEIACASVRVVVRSKDVMLLVLRQVKYAYFQHRNFFLAQQKQVNPLLTVRNNSQHSIKFLCYLSLPCSLDMMVINKRFVSNLKSKKSKHFSHVTCNVADVESGQFLTYKKFKRLKKFYRLHLTRARSPIFSSNKGPMQGNSYEKSYLQTHYLPNLSTPGTTCMPSGPPEFSSTITEAVSLQ